MEWYVIRVTRTNAIQGTIDRLLGELGNLFREGKCASKSGVFSAQVSDQACDIYISPGAVPGAGQIIHHYLAIPSSPPPATAKHLLGSPAALDPSKGKGG